MSSLGGITDIMIGIAKLFLGGYISFFLMIYKIKNMYLIKNVDEDEKILLKSKKNKG